MEFAGYVTFAAAVLIVCGLIAIYRQERRRTAEIETLAKSLRIETCSVCGSHDCALYMFRHFRFIGIAPIAYFYFVEPRWRVMCPGHARSSSLEVCRRIGLEGHWGFPGCIAAVWYVVKNIGELHKAGTLSVSCAANCLIQGVVLGWLLLGVGVILLFAVLVLLSDLFY